MDLRNKIGRVVDTGGEERLLKSMKTGNEWRGIGHGRKRRGEGRIIPGGKQTTNRPNRLEKRVCVCQYHCLSARVKVLSADLISLWGWRPRNSTSFL